MPDDIKILILAAGKGHRMGSTKQLLPYQQQTLLGSVIELANSLSLGKPLVVLGYEAEEILSTLGDVQAEFITNYDWSKGMGNTLSEAVKAASDHKTNVQAVLVLLADQPRVTRAHLLRLVQAYLQEKYRIIATKYSNGGGVPAIFDKSIFPDLMKLEGDQGARQIIRNHAEVGLFVSDDEEVWDIDTPDDYQRLLGKDQ
ncbi:nucleotidyltransferase family protein [Flavobacteriaceae bacterium D16]|nr:nucleotidyltransferase family protein [Flavobacteriaceae bacterium D16]